MLANQEVLNGFPNVVSQFSAMVVEVYLKGNQPSEEQLPDTILELECRLGEVRLSYEKLKESTDLLIDECRAATSESDARDYYSYAQENLAILEVKAEFMKRIQTKIDQLRGVFPSAQNQDNSQAVEQQGTDSGHFI